MIIKKIIYNNGKNEGYFVKTRNGYIQVVIREGELFNLQKIKKQTEIEINEATLKVKEVLKNATYIG